MEVDLRSTSQVAIDAMECDLRKVVHDAGGEGLSIDLETIGDRPAGSLPADAPLVELSVASLEALGLQAELAAASTDANFPASRGIPAISIGISRGGGMHSPDEWIDEHLISMGLKHLLTVVVSAAGLRP
jgi:acetylornithine deacetylase/succinyl-diaminopimelate desuccinylase-like protein